MLRSFLQSSQRGIENSFTLSSKSLSLMRISLGLSILVHSYYLLQKVKLFYTDSGLLPRQIDVPFKFEYLPGLSHLSGNAGWQYVLVFLLSAGAASLLVGYRPKLSCFLCWIILIAFSARAPILAYGVDRYIILVLFWSFFLPLTEHYSLGRASSENRNVQSLACAGLIGQISLIMIFSGLNKTNPSWMDGSFLQKQFDFFMTSRPMGDLLLSYPTLLALITKSVKWGQILSGTLLLIPRARNIAIFGIALMHISFAASMRLVVFPIIGLTSLVGLIKIKGPILKMEIGRKTKMFIRACLLYIVLANLSMLYTESLKPLGYLEFFGRTLALNQQWHMFGHKVNRSGWYYAEAIKNGQATPLWQSPPLEKLNNQNRYHFFVPTFSFLYFMRLSRPFFEKAQNRFTDFLCERHQNKNYEKVRLYYLEESMTADDFRRVRPPPLAVSYCDNKE